MIRDMILVFAIVLAAAATASPIKSHLAATGTSYAGGGNRRLPDGLIAVEYIQIGNRTNQMVTPLRFCDLPSSTLTATISLSGGLNADYVLGVLVSTSGGWFSISGYSSIGLRVGNTTTHTITSATSLWENPKQFVLDFFRNVVLLDGNEVADLKPKDLWDANVKEALKTNTSAISVARIGTSYFGKVGARFHSMTCELSGSPLFDFQPVRFLNESAEWEGAMYDFISGHLFRNLGEGSFVIGPDKQH